MARKRAAGKRASYNRACAECSKVKKKCDGSRPCSRCARLSLPCTDKIDHRFRRRERDDEESLPGDAAVHVAKRQAVAAAGSRSPVPGTPAFAEPPIPVSSGVTAAISSLADGPGGSALPHATLLGLGLFPLLQSAMAQAGGAGASSAMSMAALGGPSMALAALANPNNALNQILSQTLINANAAATASASRPMLDWNQAVGDLSTPQPPPRMCLGATAAAAAHLACHIPDTQGAASSFPAQGRALSQRDTMQGDACGQLAPPGAPPRVIPPTASADACFLQDVSQSTQLPCGLEGEDPIVHFSNSMRLAKCPLPTCRMVFDAKFNTPVCVHANRGIAGLFNWCTHDLITPITRVPAYMLWIDPVAAKSRLAATLAAKQRGLGQYSVRSTFLRPKSTTRGGFFDPLEAEWERFSCTEVVRVERASNGATILSVTLMDMRELAPEQAAVSSEVKLKAVALGNLLSKALEETNRRAEQTLDGVPPVSPPPRPPGTPARTALEAWHGARTTLAELPPAKRMFEARTSLHLGQTKSLLTTSVRALGCMAYLAYMVGMFWTGHPAAVEALRAFDASRLAPVDEAGASTTSGTQGKSHPTMFNAEAGTKTTATVDAAQSTQQHETPSVDPPAAAPALDSLSAAAMAALQAEIHDARLRGEQLAQSAGTASSKTSGDGREWPEDAHSAASRATHTAAGDVGAPAVPKADGDPAMTHAAHDALSTSGFTLGSAFSDTGFDELMHPMAAGGVRHADGAPTDMSAVAAQGGVIHLLTLGGASPLML